jgi:hypothetical protein
MKNKKNKNVVYRLKDGRFAPAPSNKVVSGRLYDFKGSVVRAGQRVGNMRLVTLHKTLLGFVKDSELKKVPVCKVSKYLANS